jgi:16S rRNA (guanine966-N2)-methyltransferase
MRVVAGQLRGRKIEGPLTEATRPTTDKAREAIFNALTSLDVVDGARVVDVYAGSGALGIEALSRGAKHCVFVENNKDALLVLRKNLQHLGLTDRAAVLETDAMGALASMEEVDLVLADPPYGFTEWEKLLQHCSAEVVVLESDRPIGDIPRFATIRERRYGRTFVAFLRHEALSEGTVEAT